MSEIDHQIEQFSQKVQEFIRFLIVERKGQAAYDFKEFPGGKKALRNVLSALDGSLPEPDWSDFNTLRSKYEFSFRQRIRTHLLLKERKLSELLVHCFTRSYRGSVTGCHGRPSTISCHGLFFPAPYAGTTHLNVVLLFDAD